MELPHNDSLSAVSYPFSPTVLSLLKIMVFFILIPLAMYIYLSVPSTAH